MRKREKEKEKEEREKEKEESEKVNKGKLASGQWCVCSIYFILPTSVNVLLNKLEQIIGQKINYFYN